MTQIPFGTASTPAQRDVERVLEQAGLAGPATRFKRLNSGITNLNWIATTPGRTVFVKLYGAKTETFINREASLDASMLAGELGVGPRLLWRFTDPGAEVYEFLEGYRGFTTDDMLDAERVARLVAHYRAMHEAAPISETRTGFQQLDQRLALCRAGNAPLPPDFDELLAQCARARAAIERAGLDLGPCHNDSYIANFMVNDSGDVRIIDWEYAANNDRLWDMANIAFAACDRAAYGDFARAYVGADDPRALARVTLYGGVMGTSWAMWAALQSMASDIAFDFRKYSIWLAANGRAMMREAAWERALDTV
ncbi:phosphotransferase family protein [Novosphingobium sp. 1949]|uniref:Phosphotransferase family protein n=1 Tax=Novosphingobium organovorum TaxID=2930092 RepID=A0ABT0BBU3_9SPHN|nr:choline/ethanolamine kinase family protein [Novosphingobium organovorum]MCJ2182522.1 phosphotransferase family protein [Novosphingobium organovorum]